MPSALSAIRSRVTTPSTVGTLVAVVLAVGSGYATGTLFGAPAASYLGMLVVGLGTPTTMESHGLLPDQLDAVVGRVVVACGASLATFFGLYLVVSESLSPLPSAAAAFVVTALASQLVARRLT